MPFETKISSARFVVGPFSATVMGSLGQVLRDSIYTRIAAGQNVEDAPAKPLKPAYVKAKERKGRAGIRDWIFQIRTLDRMAVISANENRAVIGFNHPLAAMHAHFQNMRERQFGVSNRDRSALVAAVTEVAKNGGAVSVRKTA